MGIDDRTLAAAHESGHAAIGRFMSAKLNASHICRGDHGGWLGGYRHGRPGDLSAIGERLLHVAGGAAEALVQGLHHPADAVRFVSAGDVAFLGVDSFESLVRLPTTEGDLRYCLHALAGPLRQVWQTDTRTLERFGRAGDWQKVPARMIPSGWVPL